MKKHPNTEKPGNWSATGYWQEFRVIGTLPKSQYREPKAMAELRERCADFRQIPSLYD